MSAQSLQFKSLSARIKAAEDGSTFEGWASVYNVLDSYNEIVAPGAFDATLAKFLAKGKIRAGHSVTVGKPTDAKASAAGLYVAGKISDTSVGRDCKILLADGVTNSLSIGFLPVVSHKLADAKAVADYWAKAGYRPSPGELARSTNGATVLDQVDLFEVSIVDFPANEACEITSVKAWLRDYSAARLALKSGRVLSSRNRSRLEKHAMALEETAKDLRGLLDETVHPDDEPAAPDDDDESEAEQSPAPAATAEKRLQLRGRSARLRASILKSRFPK